MAEKQEVKKSEELRISNTVFDLVILVVVLTFVFMISFFFDVFGFLVTFFQKNPAALNFVDEIIAAFLVLSIGFAVISWRRIRELRRETAERIRLQAKMLEDYETKLAMEKIICQGLHCDIEQYRKLEQEARFKRQEDKGKDKDADINK